MAVPPDGKSPGSKVSLAAAMKRLWSPRDTRKSKAEMETLSVSIAEKPRTRTIPKLPEEVIIQIFQIIAEQELSYYDEYRWWYIPVEYSDFFKTASLVSRAWRRLSLEMLHTACISGTTLFAPRRWKQAGKSLSFIRNLHLYGGEDVVGKKLSRIPKAIPEPLLAQSSFITSLSFEAVLLRLPPVRALLSDIASRVRRLHIYCPETSTRLSSKAFFWKEATWLFGNTNLQELVLDGIIVYGGETQELQPCSAQMVRLQHVIFEFIDPAVDWIVLFPLAKQLFIERERPLGRMGMALNSPSDRLEVLEISWDFQGRHHPLEGFPGILYSPKLPDVDIWRREEYAEGALHSYVAFY